MIKFKKYKVRVWCVNMKLNIIDHALNLGYEFDGIREEGFLFYFNSDGSIVTDKDYDYFTIYAKCKEISYEEFLRLTLRDVQQKVVTDFDIEPTNPVLVRNTIGSNWRLRFFERPIFDNTQYRYSCVNGAEGAWAYVVKYDPKLKKYIGSSDDIPGAYGPDTIFKED